MHTASHTHMYIHSDNELAVLYHVEVSSNYSSLEKSWLNQISGCSKLPSCSRIPTFSSGHYYVL